MDGRTDHTIQCILQGRTFWQTKGQSDRWTIQTLDTPGKPFRLGTLKRFVRKIIPCSRLHWIYITIMACSTWTFSYSSGPLMPNYILRDKQKVNMAWYFIIKKEIVTKLHSEVWPIRTDSQLTEKILQQTPEWQHSKECMCHLQNIAMCDYQESVTTGQTHKQTDAHTDAGQSDPYVPLCFTGDTTRKVITIQLFKCHWYQHLNILCWNKEIKFKAHAHSFKLNAILFIRISFLSYAPITLVECNAFHLYGFPQLSVMQSTVKHFLFARTLFSLYHKDTKL